MVFRHNETMRRGRRNEHHIARLEHARHSTRMDAPHVTGIPSRLPLTSSPPVTNVPSQSGTTIKSRSFARVEGSVTDQRAVEPHVLVSLP